MNWADLTALLGALGVGALISTWVSWAKDRRGARADVRRALAEVERLRWARNPATEPEEFERESMALWVARRDLAVSAMLAGLPREPVDHYVRLAAVSFTASKETWERQNRTPGSAKPEPGQRGPIESPVSEAVDDGRDLMIDMIWRPFRTRLTWKRRLGRMKATERAILEQPAARQLRYRYEMP